MQNRISLAWQIRMSVCLGGLLVGLSFGTTILQFKPTNIDAKIYRYSENQSFRATNKKSQLFQKKHPKSNYKLQNNNRNKTIPECRIPPEGGPLVNKKFEPCNIIN